MITESLAEQAAQDWLDGLGYQVVSRLMTAPGEPTAERADYKQVFLFDRLRTKTDEQGYTRLKSFQVAQLAISESHTLAALLPNLLSGELHVSAARIA